MEHRDKGLSSTTYAPAQGVFELLTDSARLKCLACNHSWNPAGDLGDEQADYQRWVLQNVRGNRVPARCPKCGSNRVSVVEYE